MGKFQDADAAHPELKYVSDGDYIQYGSISNPNQLSLFSSYDQIYLAAHGVWVNNQWTGFVNIGGVDYQPSQTSASNLIDFKYCGASGIVGINEVSGSWFYQVAPFLQE